VHVALIYNPKAGQLLRNPGLIPQVADILTRGGGTVELLPTSHAGHATELARQCATQNIDRIYVAGGDGTLSEAANGLVGAQIPLVPLPGGTANCLAIELGIGTRIRRAAENAASYTAKRIPLGLCKLPDGRARYFLAMAGAGVDADIVRRVNPQLKRHLGKAAYWVAGFSNFFQVLPELRLRNGSFSRAGTFALASRIRNYGGDLEIARRIRIDEPCFETVLFEGRFALGYSIYLFGVLARIHQSLPGVHVAKAREVQLEAVNGRPVYLQLDGEQIGELPAQLEIVPDALLLAAPWRN
jgi:diacylglycerol kinase family enzyme